jgi:hypothetical protein
MLNTKRISSDWLLFAVPTLKALLEGFNKELSHDSTTSITNSIMAASPNTARPTPRSIPSWVIEPTLAKMVARLGMKNRFSIFPLYPILF